MAQDDINLRYHMQMIMPKKHSPKQKHHLSQAWKGKMLLVHVSFPRGYCWALILETKYEFWGKDLETWLLYVLDVAPSQ